MIALLHTTSGQPPGVIVNIATEIQHLPTRDRPSGLDIAQVHAQLPLQLEVQAAPFLKWVGGKGKLITQLERHIPSGSLRYGEVFTGGGALFFHLRSQGRLQHALLGDRSVDIVNALTVVRDQPGALISELRGHELAYLSADAEARAEYFYWMRGRHPAEVALSDVERAARMLFLNRTCFNGLWRENASGRFNSPHGRYEKPAIAQEPRLRAASQALQGVAIVQTDFRAWPQLARDHGLDFVYLDPPYHPLTATSSFNAYSGGSFSAQSQADLAEVCGELDRMGVRWLLSNSDCPFIRDLYGRWQIDTVWAARAINCKAEARGEVREVVVRNWK